MLDKAQSACAGGLRQFHGSLLVLPTPTPVSILLLRLRRACCTGGDLQVANLRRERWQKLRRAAGRVRNPLDSGVCQT